jgi:hypothetical protein
MMTKLCWIGLIVMGCGDKDAPPKEPDVVKFVETPEDSGEAPLASSFEVTGTIVDADDTPVVEAMVLVGGQIDTMVYTDSDGVFSLWVDDNGLGDPAIVAAKHGYRAAGFEYFRPDVPISITIVEVRAPDNLAYEYQEPGDGTDSMKENCSHCHTTFVRDFIESKHAEATRNPMLQDLYAGVTQAYSDESSCTDAGGLWAEGHAPGTEGGSQAKCYLGGGVLPDLNPSCGGDGQDPCDGASLSSSDKPDAFGACADCHAPGINGVAGGRDLHEAHGLAYDIGVHCDTCHKVRDVDLSQPPGVGQRLIMGRPSEPGNHTFAWDPVYFGPLIDVPNVAMGGSYQPKFNESTFCAGCHEQNQEALLPDEELDTELWPDGLPVHSTFSEWEAGPYNQEATACQFCHMPGNVELNNSVDISTKEDQSIAFGFPRAPEDNRNHTFRGPLDGSPRLIDGALYVSIDLDTTADTIEATVSVANIGCGHAIPTGEPMRSLILLVEADGDCGTLDAMGGLTIPDTGGAYAAGSVGTDITATDTTLLWPAAAALAEAGQVVRLVRPSGVFYDYNGPGIFGGDTLDAEDKGMEIDTPMGQAIVLEVDGDEILLDTALDLQTGDRVYLGDAWPDAPEDGQPALHLAGRAGTSFSKVLLDSAGNRHVPHYRAVDMESDNRIKPGDNALTSHAFERPSGCTTGTVQATILYRPVPLSMASVRGWDSTDHIVAKATSTWSE